MFVAWRLGDLLGLFVPCVGLLSLSLSFLLLLLLLLLLILLLLLLLLLFLLLLLLFLLLLLSPPPLSPLLSFRDGAVLLSWTNLFAKINLVSNSRTWISCFCSIVACMSTSSCWSDTFSFAFCNSPSNSSNREEAADSLACMARLTLLASSFSSDSFISRS